MIVKFFYIFDAVRRGSVTAEKTANTDGCIYSAYFEIIFVF